MVKVVLRGKLIASNAFFFYYENEVFNSNICTHWQNKSQKGKPKENKDILENLKQLKNMRVLILL